MKRCFLLFLIFITIMAPGARAESGAESIFWTRAVGDLKYMKFSHDGRLIGFIGEETAGVVRTSDSSLLWKDSLPIMQGHLVGISTLAFSLNDSLFAYTRAFDKNIYIKYSATGLSYKTIEVDSLIDILIFIDSTKILLRNDKKTYIYDFKNEMFVYTQPYSSRPFLSSTGKYKVVLPQTKPYIVEKPQLYRIYKDSIGKQQIEFTGQAFPGGVTDCGFYFSKDDKLLILCPWASEFPNGMAMYIYNLETLVCNKLIVPGIKKFPDRGCIDADNKHIVLFAHRLEDTTNFRDNLIVSLEDGSIKNYYRIINIEHDQYILGYVYDVSPDSLHYLCDYYGGIALLKAVRTTSDVPMPKPISDVRIFPNPSNSGSQTISIEGISEAKSIIISDIFGREAFRSDFIQSGSNSGISFQIPSLQKGVYFISIIDGEGRKIAKKLMVGE